METTETLSKFFNLLAEQPDPPVIELLNIDHKPVGALYLGHFLNKGKPIVVSQTNNQERYYFYCDGIGIFFSWYRRLYDQSK